MPGNKKLHLGIWVRVAISQDTTLHLLHLAAQDGGSAQGLVCELSIQPYISSRPRWPTVRSAPHFR